MVVQLLITFMSQVIKVSIVVDHSLNIIMVHKVLVLVIVQYMQLVVMLLKIYIFNQKVVDIFQ